MKNHVYSTMIAVALIITLTSYFQDIPNKPDNEFAIRLELKFKGRQLSKGNEIKVSETIGEYERRTSVDELPYLILYVSFLELNLGESRVKILRDGKVFGNNKKIEVGKEIKLEVGFTDDAKDKISGYEHILYLLSDDKKQISKIVITIEENGDYLVNGQKRGRV